MVLRFGMLLVAFAALIAVPCTASAALLTFFNKAAYDAQVTASLLTPANFTNFEAVSVGPKGPSFSASGIGFGIGAGALRVSSTTIDGGATNSGVNFLGFDDAVVTDFQAGDTVTLTLPAGSRAIGLNISSPSLLDGSNFGRLDVSGTTIDTAAANGSVISGATMGYFLGIVNTTSNINSATLSFTGSGLFRVDDVGVATVPEPNSFALAAVAGLLGLARRRGRRS